MSLLGSTVDTRGRLLIAWYGPRGLSSLLLILLPVFAGVSGSDRLFAISSLVVLVSIVLHGGSPMLLARAARKRALIEQRDSKHELGSKRASEEDLPAQSQVEQLPKSVPITTCPISTDQESVCPVDSETEPLSQPAATITTKVGAQSISIDELRRLWQAQEPVAILDVRTERSIDSSSTQAKEAIRMPPEHVVEQAKELGLKPETWLIAYCA
jgi:NhaP-type Na+/H+ or K+/H+ antiporter